MEGIVVGGGSQGNVATFKEETFSCQTYVTEQQIRVSTNFQIYKQLRYSVAGLGKINRSCSGEDTMLSHKTAKAARAENSSCGYKKAVFFGVGASLFPISSRPPLSESNTQNKDDENKGEGGHHNNRGKASTPPTLQELIFEDKKLLDFFKGKRRVLI